MEEIKGGATSARLFRTVDKEGRGYIIKKLKREGSSDSLLHEKQVYEWLWGKVKVPEFVSYRRSNTEETLCMTEIEGVTLENLKETLSTEKVIKLYANVLKDLHALPIQGCHIFKTVENKIAQALKNVEYGLVDIEDLESENQHLSPYELFEMLLEKKPKDHEEWVFTHGDFCMDNLIFKGNELSGYIDMGRGGVADRYQDIALAVRNIQHELGEEWLTLFYKEYGLKNPNNSKIAFYILLDEFF